MAEVFDKEVFDSNVFDCNLEIEVGVYPERRLREERDLIDIATILAIAKGRAR